PTEAPPGNGSGNGPSVGGTELFGSWDDESTRVLPRVPGSADASTQRMRAASPAPGAGTAGSGAGVAGAGVAGAGVAGAGATAAMAAATGPTARVPGGPGAGGPPPAAPGPSGGGDGPTGDDPDAGGGSGRRPRRTGLLIAAVVIGIVVLAYLGDLLFSSGSVPRGVTVAGQNIGGLSRAAAIEQLQTAIEPRSSRPVQVTAGPVRSEIDPKTAGLSVDYAGTLDRAGAQPLNPITRISSFFTNRDVGVVNKADERSVRTAMEQLVPVVDREPKDGTVRFEGLNPVPVEPVPGQRLDVDKAVGTLEQQWATGAPVALPLIIQQAATTPGDVQTAIDEVAKPAVSAPLTVTGEGANATVAPEDIAQALTFKADPNGAQKLVPQINVESITDVVTPQLEKTEKPGVDATLDFASNPPKVVPSQDGRGIDYKASFANLLPVLTGPGPRTVPAIYTVKPPDITTAKIQSLGSAGEISTFTTGGFSPDSGQNIKRAAEAIDGQIVQPGETFSLDGATNPRDASRGYVEAGIIEDGAPARGIGGGVSQLATTLYNASYFAGMVDVEHKEHSYYISRYPAAREATVFDDIIDVKFRNDGPTAVLIKTAWTPSNVTVKFFGTKRYDVSSSSGPRTNYTDPQVVTIPPGQPCNASKGSRGFTATDTRTMRDVTTGETTSKTRTVKYNPQPIVRCGG
ncbi:VanW family protein, partial [Pseudonocardia sp. KRD291]|uniref:VanW family protein n=1 Tax=Pseudonocardia sp. KRD291 TaxID=2792007 RepID=UPI001C4A3247